MARCTRGSSRLTAASALETCVAGGASADCGRAPAEIPGRHAVSCHAPFEGGPPGERSPYRADCLLAASRPRHHGACLTRAGIGAHRSGAPGTPGLRRDQFPVGARRRRRQGRHTRRTLDRRRRALQPATAPSTLTATATPANRNRAGRTSCRTRHGRPTMPVTVPPNRPITPPVRTEAPSAGCSVWWRWRSIQARARTPQR